MEQYEYVLNKTLMIDKELTLTSYKSGYNPNITMNIDLDKCDIAVTFFNITKSCSKCGECISKGKKVSKYVLQCFLTDN